MAENSHIEWTTHTFNPWWGCTKVSAACDNCYAETLATRFGTGWGKDADRKFFTDKHWAEPVKWNRKAEKGATEDERHPRIFCASMADVFEDNDTLLEARSRLFDLIEATPNLTWLLLTKRPHLMTRFAPKHWAGGWPVNAWAMTTVEDQVWADARIPHLMKVPAVVRGLSMEPLLGGVKLPADFLALGKAAWVITGGESGPGARPGNPDWYRTLRNQSVAAGVPFHFKQWGDIKPTHRGMDTQSAFTAVHGIEFEKIGKHAAGRELDGRTWDERPTRDMEAV